MRRFNPIWISLAMTRRGIAMNAEEVDMRRTDVIRWASDGLSTGQRQNSAALIRKRIDRIWNGSALL